MYKVTTGSASALATLVLNLEQNVTYLMTSTELKQDLILLAFSMYAAQAGNITLMVS
jgi:hypothetical protein